MTSQHDKAKRWRPRFSVRTLVIIVTLVCCYFGAWELTKRHGTIRSKPFVTYTQGGEVVYFRERDYSPMPFVVLSDYRNEQDERGVVYPTYFLWFFGPRVKLIEASWDGWRVQ